MSSDLQCRFGIQAALIRRANEGGSYEVVSSLTKTGQWICSLGRDFSPSSFKREVPSPKDLEQDGGLEKLQDPQSGQNLTYVKHSAEFPGADFRVEWSIAPKGSYNRDEAKWIK